MSGFFALINLLPDVVISNRRKEYAGDCLPLTSKLYPVVSNNLSYVCMKTPCDSGCSKARFQLLILALIEVKVL